MPKKSSSCRSQQLEAVISKEAPQTTSSFTKNILLAVLLPVVALLVHSCASSSEKENLENLASFASSDGKLEAWQTCDVFMAPTNISGTGWGVFAARDFQENELYNILPLFVPLEVNDPNLPLEHRVVKNTQLDDYVYGVNRRHIKKKQQMVLFGYEMVYNHHPNGQNVQFGLGGGYKQGFYAKKAAQAGEQLFSSYGAADRGADWFTTRGLTMKLDEGRITTPEQLSFLSGKYCSKIYAGPGQQSYVSLIPSIDPSRVAPFEAGLFDARAKVPIRTGDILEEGPAVLLYKAFVEGTALAPLGIMWDQLQNDHREVLRRVSAPDDTVPIQYQGPASQSKRIYRRATLENLVIFPFAGRMGLIHRVGSSDPTANCRLEVKVEEIDNTVSVVLAVIATRDVQVGHGLQLALDPAGTGHERRILRSKLDEIGYSYAHLD